MTDMHLPGTLSRRTLLRRSAILPGLSLGLLSACSDDTANACFDAQYLGAGETQMRKTLEYVDLSAKPATRCANCQFLRKPERAGCGDCEILDGPVSAAGFCTSWAARS